MCWIPNSSNSLLGGARGCYRENQRQHTMQLTVGTRTNFVHACMWLRPLIYCQFKPSRPYIFNKLEGLTKKKKTSRFKAIPWLLPSGPRPPGSTGTWCHRLQEPADQKKVLHKRGFCVWRPEGRHWHRGQRRRFCWSGSWSRSLCLLAPCGRPLLGWWRTAEERNLIEWKRGKHLSHLLHIVNLLLSCCHLRLKCLALLCERVPVSGVVLQNNVLALLWLESDPLTLRSSSLFFAVVVVFSQSFFISLSFSPRKPLGF